jgi:hypothetical protein
MSKSKQSADELMTIGIDEGWGDDEILATLEAEGLLEAKEIIEASKETETTHSQIKAELRQARSIQSSLLLLKSPQSEDEAFLLKQKLIFSLKKHKELQYLKQSYFQTQMLIHVAVVILFSCYCALFIQQKLTQNRIGHLYQLDKTEVPLEKTDMPKRP